MAAHPDLILAVPVSDIRAAQRFDLPMAHMAYRIGGGPHLFRANLPVPVHSGLMVIDDTGFDGRGESAPFCQEVMRECSARGYTGVICDFERPLTLSGRIVSELAPLLARQGWPLYVTEQYAPQAPSARVLIPSALSGGTLRGRLSEAVERYGVERVALSVQRAAEDFFLPSHTGSGSPLTQEELKARIAERSPSIFFSNELCAHYFTYMTRQNGAHFVLFDDGPSIRKKLQTARSLGISHCLLPYPDVADILDEILS